MIGITSCSISYYFCIYFCFSIYACSRDSSMTIPAPSPITKPFLSLSKGIDALKGSLLVLKAVSDVNPAKASGVIDASAPPAIITSALSILNHMKSFSYSISSCSTSSNYIVHIPLAPYLIAIFPAAILLIIIGIKNGDTLFGPFSESSFYACSSIVLSHLYLNQPLLQIFLYQYGSKSKT